MFSIIWCTGNWIKCHLQLIYFGGVWYALPPSHLSGPHTLHGPSKLHFVSFRSVGTFYSNHMKVWCDFKWLNSKSKQWTLDGHRTRNQRNGFLLVAHFTINSIKFNTPEATKCSTIHNVRTTGPSSSLNIIIKVFFTKVRAPKTDTSRRQQLHKVVKMALHERCTMRNIFMWKILLCCTVESVVCDACTLYYVCALYTFQWNSLFARHTILRTNRTKSRHIF